MKKLCDKKKVECCLSVSTSVRIAQGAKRKVVLTLHHRGLHLPLLPEESVTH